jgi:hypothetical protein
MMTTSTTTTSAKELQEIKDRIDDLKSQEESRKLLSNTLYLRNRTYWRELRKLQAERSHDSKILLSHIELSLFRMKTLLQYWKAYETDHRSQLESERNSIYTIGSVSGLTTAPGPSTSSSSAANNTTSSSNSKSLSIGQFSSTLFTELEQSNTNALTQSIELFEKGILQVFVEKFSHYEKDILFLWEEGKKLFVAWILIEQRVNQAYHALFDALSHLHASNTSYIYNATSSIWSSSSVTGKASDPGSEAKAVVEDIWLLQLKYNESCTRYQRITTECNRQFRTLFNLAKQLEQSRVNFTARAAGKYLLFLLTTVLSSVITTALSF